MPLHTLACLWVVGQHIFPQKIHINHFYSKTVVSQGGISLPRPHSQSQPEQMAKEASNIVQLLEKAALTDAGFSIYPPGNAPSKCIRTSYHAFLQKAQVNAQSIGNIPGISKDSIILLHFDNHTDNLDWFWAVTISGYTPAVSTPFVNDPDQRKKHLNHLHNLLGNPVVLTTQALTSEFRNCEELRLCPIEKLSTFDKRNCDRPEMLVNGHLSDSPATRPRGDTAVLMLTSGSTGNAKAVPLSHYQIIQSVKGKSQHLGTSSSDPFLNWIGLDHVANLLETQMHAMYLCAEQVHVQASDLLMEPLTFLYLIDKHRVSYTFSPNFFIASLRRAFSGIDTAHSNRHLDLSCLKFVVCGGEANVVATLVAVTEMLTPYGAKDGFFRPAFGMTETCGGSMYGSDCPSYEVKQGLEFSTVGTCIPGTEMRIMRDEGDQRDAKAQADVGEAGNFQMRGSALFKEYYNNSTATQESFTQDGWFMTGDKGYVDTQGNLILTGRSKETVIINGVKYFPHEIETAIEEGFVAGTTPSYTIVFPHRPTGSQTEELCVVYLPTYEEDDAKARAETTERISQVCIMVASVRPYRTIPLPKEYLEKSSLGKIARSKIRTAFEAGKYREFEDKNDRMIKNYRASKQETPATEVEEQITDIFCEMFDLPREVAWVGSSLFDFGVTSLELIAFKQRVQNKLTSGQEIPVLMVMNNPTIRGMAQVLQIMAQGPRPYNPVVTLQSKGDNTPLWLVHPGTGEVLVYVGLAKYIIDRPLHALRARGFEKGEECFHDLSEIVGTYHAHMKKVQPSGPYALLGWSEGALVAYEMARVLESNGDTVAFCGNLDTTPLISPSSLEGFFGPLNILIHLSYLIELTTREHALSMSDTLQRGTYDEALDYVLGIATPERLAELELDRPKLTRWVEVMCSLYGMLEGYDPIDKLERLDVFIADQSGLIAQDRWLNEHMYHWRDHSRTEVGFHMCDGVHHTMLTQGNMPSFQRNLKKALKARGL